MKNAIISIGLLLLLALAGCNQGLQAAAVAEQTIKVGWTGPLTGDAALVGSENLRGVEVAVDEINANGGINGHKLELVVENDEYDDAKAISAYTKLTEMNDIEYVLSVTYGGIMSLGSRADADKVVLMNSLDTSEEMASAGDYVFAVGVYDEGIGYRLAEFVAERGENAVGIVYNNIDPFVLMVVDSFTSKFKELNGSVAVAEKYEPEQKDFRAQIVKIQKSGVDTVLIVGYDEAGLVLRQAKELGLKATFLGIDTVLSEGFSKNAGDAYEGIYFTNWVPSNAQLEKAFFDGYRQKYGEEPEQLLYAACGYDALRVLAEAMKKSELTTESVYEQLYSISGFSGLTGTLTMSADGIVRSVQEEMYQIVNGESVKVR